MKPKRSLNAGFMRPVIGMAWSCILLLGCAAPSPAASVPSTLAAEVQAGFPEWDANGDGLLTRDELERAVASPKVQGTRAAAAVALLRASNHKIYPLSLPLTKEQLAGTLRTASGGQIAGEETEEPERSGVSSMAAYYAEANAKIAASPRELFVNGGPHMEALRQGKLNTCYCLAAITACIARDPASVAARFAVKPLGYTVRFGQDRVVEVSPLTDGEIALGSTTGGDGVWGAVYEKAVGVYRMNYEGAIGTPLEAASKGGSAGTMLSVLTGQKIVRFSFAPWHDGGAPDRFAKLKDLRSMIVQNLAAHHFITTGAGSKGPKVPSLSKKHAYAVLDYDAATDLVTIRDPHGQTFSPKGEPGLRNGYAVSKGVFKAPLTEVVQVMRGMAFTQDAPAVLPSAKKVAPADDITD